MKRERIDKLLVERGLVESRTKAQALVMAGRVLVNDQLVSKPSELYLPDAFIRLKGADDPASRYVSRGGLKLEAALAQFQIKVDGLICLDVGSSTGGFTDCLLQQGARRVVAVDVGHNQLDWRLRNDPRVEIREGINARHLRAAEFADRFDLIVMDLAFISATKVLPAVVPLAKESGYLIVLIKPQFEVGRREVGKGGIVREPEKHARVIENVNRAAAGLDLELKGLMESPITGAEGNVEFLAFYQRIEAEKS
ncbi:MAG TPA: TlyA family RNA methyltransferase [Pyrinomonadaceae bacterium]|nr:TlyA family RNA methyltransferase [Pyrinomonadaceae bacterium]